MDDKAKRIREMCERQVKQKWFIDAHHNAPSPETIEIEPMSKPPITKSSEIECPILREIFDTVKNQGLTAHCYPDWGDPTVIQDAGSNLPISYSLRGSKLRILWNFAGEPSLLTEYDLADPANDIQKIVESEVDGELYKSL